MNRRDASDIVLSAADAVRRIHASQRIRHLPVLANRPDVTPASWIEVC